MIEVTEFARRIVESPDVETKLAPPNGPLSFDDHPAPCRIAEPGRTAELEIIRGKFAPVPPPHQFGNPAKRARILHALANHELQATELYAWALVKFSDAPRAMREDLASVLADEQRHTRMYIGRLESLGHRFGEYPVSGYFWHISKEWTTPMHFFCAMALTFEHANLDHTIDLAELARQAGDERTAAVIDRVHDDEIEHVRYGWKWLEAEPAEERAMWQRYVENLTAPHLEKKGIGHRFHPSGRERAGLSPDFVEAALEAARDRMHPAPPVLGSDE